MELLKLIRYPDLMRSWLSIFLVAVFAVVHTTAAFGADRAGLPAPAQQVEALSMTLAVAGAHHMKCCEQPGEQSKTQKASSCSADCISWLGARTVALPQVKIAPEQVQPPEFTASKPSPENRPPRQV
jgi:hypothetical protein